jgi:hypothetical protein
MLNDPRWPLIWPQVVVSQFHYQCLCFLSESGCLLNWTLPSVSLPAISLNSVPGYNIMAARCHVGTILVVSGSMTLKDIVCIWKWAVPIVASIGHFIATIFTISALDSIRPTLTAQPLLRSPFPGSVLQEQIPPPNVRLTIGWGCPYLPSAVISA